MAYPHPELPPDNQAAYDEITGQPWQQGHLSQPSVTNLDGFPHEDSQLLGEPVADREKNSPPGPEIAKDLSDSSQRVTPAIERLPVKGTRIVVSKRDLPIEIVVVDADSTLKVFRN